MNKKKNGQFEILSNVGGFNSDSFTQFVKSMNISDYDHEIWYGDNLTASKMKGEELEKTLTNPLKTIELGKQPMDLYIDMVSIKKKTNPNWPELVKFFATSIEHFDI